MRFGRIESRLCLAVMRLACSRPGDSMGANAMHATRIACDQRVDLHAKRAGRQYTSSAHFVGKPDMASAVVVSDAGLSGWSVGRSVGVGAEV